MLFDNAVWQRRLTPLFDHAVWPRRLTTLFDHAVWQCHLTMLFDNAIWQPHLTTLFYNAILQCRCTTPFDNPVWPRGLTTPFDHAVRQRHLTRPSRTPIFFEEKTCEFPSFDNHHWLTLTLSDKEYQFWRRCSWIQRFCWFQRERAALLCLTVINLCNMSV